MTLANTYQRFYLVLLSLLLVLGCVTYYLTIRYVLIHQVDNDLRIEQQELMDFVHLHDSLPAPSHYRDQYFSWQAVAGVQDVPKRRVQNGRVLDTHDGEWEPARTLMFPVQVRGRPYLVNVSKSLEQTENLLWLIFWVTAGSVAVLVAGLVLGNRFLLRRIWHPFYETLDYLGNFRLYAPTSGKPPASRIDEFALLSRSVDEMTSKMQKDYFALQQFTDHAAHEMQTPLAVIKGKLDLMMQDPSLGARQLEQMQQLQQSVSRLNRLNQALLLLTRIENQQFLEKEMVGLGELVEEKMESWQEWIRQHELEVGLDLQPGTAYIHPFLAESLVNNLISNAVRHNIPGGEIHVQSAQGLLRVKNTGRAQPLDPERIFQRFVKQYPSEGVGLGLAIVKEIVDMSGMNIRYDYAEGTHTFTVTF